MYVGRLSYVFVVVGFGDIISPYSETSSFSVLFGT